MLELALKQERVKYYRLKFGTEPNELKLPTSTSQSNNENNSGTRINHMFKPEVLKFLTRETLTNILIFTECYEINILASRWFFETLKLEEKYVCLG